MKSPIDELIEKCSPDGVVTWSKFDVWRLSKICRELKAGLEWFHKHQCKCGDQGVDYVCKGHRGLPQANAIASGKEGKDD